MREVRIGRIGRTRIGREGGKGEKGMERERGGDRGGS